ncbi:MAG: DUF2779 domain-containing protein [Endomicrobium sp.]|jgi:CRISPR/Cas system-associated exonuclease Cas4 (RecB family)|nr:DUF2779 domain-containing protein [Endomicrobium sp.]
MKKRMTPKLVGLNSEFLKLELRNIHKMSKCLFPDAVSNKYLKIEDQISTITELILGPSDIGTFCDISLVVKGYYVKADILRKLEDASWHLFEIKLGSKHRSKYINDVSFTAMVLAKAGVNISKISLLYLSHNYRLGMDVSRFFNELDCTEKVEPKVQEFLDFSDEVFENIESENMPKPYLKRSCRNCLVFNVCMGKDVKDHIFDLPRLSLFAVDKLIALGVDTIDKIPESFGLTEIQQVVKNSVLTDTTYVSKKLKSKLEILKQPFYYLDFEFITPTIPLYKNIAPYTQLLTQFSLDKTDGVGNVLNHYEYIADHTKDCRREIAEKLIEYLDKDGTIITYANSEYISVSKLIKLFPDLNEKLSRILEKIVDLELILRKNYYNVSFHGRSSIKKILPVLIPKMNYKVLKIGEGRDAAAAFAFMAMGLYDDEKIEDTKRNLLKYCAQDTLAMIYIHQFLINVVENHQIGKRVL